VVAFFALLGIANGVWLARIPAVKHHLRLSDGLLGIALLAAPVGLVLVVLLAGKIVDRVGSRRPVLAAAPCVALLPVALGLAPNMAVLMASLFGFGVASGMLDVAMNDQAVHVERGYQRPLMSSFHACYSFGGLAGSLFGGLFAWIGLSPAVNFLAAGAPLGVLALLAGRWLLRTPAGRRPVPARPVPELAVPELAVPDLAVRGRAAGTRHGRMLSGRALVASGRRSWSPAILVLGLLALCSLLGEGAADGWSAVYMHDSLGASAGFAALGYAAFAVTMAFGRLAGDRLAARFGPVALVRGCGLLAAAGLAGALISADRVGALVGFALFGAGLSCTFPQLLSAAGNADPARPAGGIARVAGMGYVGMLGGPVMIGGLASAAGLSLALGLPVILALCIAAGAGQVRRGRTARSPGRP
jgi:MFS family permease